MKLIQLLQQHPLTCPLRFYLGQLILHLALGRFQLLHFHVEGGRCGLELLLDVSEHLLQEGLHQGLQGRRVGLLFLSFGHVDI